MIVDLNQIGAAGETVLVVKPSSLGDVVHTLPAVSALAARSPGAALHWVVNSEWAPLLAGHPQLRSVIEFPRRQFRGYRPASIRAAGRWADQHLAPLRPALALDFQGLLRSALLANAAGSRHIVGFSRCREGASLFYHERVDVRDWDRRHAVYRYLDLVAALGATVPQKGVDRLDFPLPDGEAPASDLPERFVVLHPFSRGVGKSLGSAEVREFCERLAPMPVVVVGSDVRDFSPPLPPSAFDLLGKTSLAQLIWVLRHSLWTVSVDSGPMHLAAAAGDRLLAIHTWTNPRVVGPCRPGAWAWRDGFLERIADIEPDRFPERRSQRRRWSRLSASLGGGGRRREVDGEEPLLESGAIERIAEFVGRQLP